MKIKLEFEIPDELPSGLQLELLRGLMLHHMQPVVVQLSDGRYQVQYGMARGIYAITGLMSPPVPAVDFNKMHDETKAEINNMYDLARESIDESGYPKDL